jgi:steroid delta-isomerase
MVNHTVDHVILWRLVPLAEDRTRAEMTMYTPTPVEGEEAEKSMRTWFDLHDSVTRDEDYPECERVHESLASGVVEATHLGRNEAALIHFHLWRRGALTTPKSVGPGADHIRQVFQRYVELLSAGDADGIAALYGDGATLQDPAGSTPIVGRAAIRDFYAAAIDRRGQPDVVLTGPVRITGAQGAAPLRSAALRDGEAISIDIIDVMTFDSEGAITSMCAYWGEENIAPA